MRHIKKHFLNGEVWYCGIINDGYQFPISALDTYKIDLKFNNTYNQINPIFLSNKGRFFWLEKAGIVCFDKGSIKIDAEEIIFERVGLSLKEVELYVTNKFFAPNGFVPNEILFKNPQICSWIHLQHNQSQEGIIKYAKDYLKSGLKAGVIIIDDSWQNDIGDWDFNKDKFPNPKQMVDDLHKLGFKVVFWLVPYVLKNSIVAEQMKKQGHFLKDKNGEYLLSTWFNGISYTLDFYKDIDRKWLLDKVDFLKSFGVDGFKLDYGDSQFLPKEYEFGNEQNELWANIIDINKPDSILELRSCYKCGGKNIVQRLADKAHTWNVQFIKDASLPDNGFLKYGFSTLIPNILAQGISGYFYGCPDMVGGGLASDFADDSTIDNELLIRSIECCTLLPMIQFSYAIWNSKDEMVKLCLKKCMEIRDEFSSYIFFLAKNASVTGMPIVRYMEYEFPNQDLEMITSQFMLGDKYLVAPVIKKGDTSKEVIFPKNTKWKNYFTNEVYSEGSFDIQCDLKTLLIFEKI